VIVKSTQLINISDKNVEENFVTPNTWSVGRAKV